MKLHYYFDAEIEGGNLHEIDIPEGATRLSYYFDTTVCQDAFIIPIPQKAKKCRYAVGSLQGCFVTTNFYATDEEVIKNYGEVTPNNIVWLHRLLETETEVDV